MREDSPGGIGIGGQGVPDLTGAASATLGSPQDQQALAQQLIQRLVQSRLGGGGGLTTGPEMAHPIMPQQPLQKSPEGVIAQGPFASVGSRKRADTQALFSNISKITQDAEKKHYEMKVQKLQHDFETLSGAMRGYEEAKASGNQEMMKHNADIINSIMSDPKKSKELAKAFDVNLNPMAEGKSKGKEKPNPAQDALKAAYAQDQKSYANKQSMLSPQAQAMMRQVPQTTQIDPRTAILEQLTKSGVLPKAAEQLTFTKDLMDISRKIEEKKLTIEDKDKLAKMLIDSQERRTSVQQTGAMLRVLAQIKGAKERTEILAKAMGYKADKNLEGVEYKADKIIDKLGADKENKALVTALNGVKAEAKTNADEMKIAVKKNDAKRMQELVKQSEAIKFKFQLLTAKAAEQTGLNPEDFSEGAQPDMDPGTQSLWNEIFSSGGEQTPPQQ